ncbi:(2Fe-2S)-binding protein [Bacillus alkalicellulosilyticus]|uniref:(2Fe-2S)-binding protein n=1 Tax=Alkalihalobacterium alkalicellulosilyticum TaxID=1912214 RepID=UPI0009977778|nr:(2Fe-2S)-binding protein [Bacillus alkalicellulosilyticus]
MTKVDYSLLEEAFYLRITDHPHKVFALSLRELQDGTRLDEFIEYYGTIQKATTRQVVSTYFFKFYGWFFSGVQSVMSLNHSELQIELDNIELQVFYNKEYDYYGLCFKLMDASERSVSKGDREKWRSQYQASIFTKNVVPLIECFAKQTNIRERELWGQFVIGVYYGHDKLVSSLTCQQKSGVVDDFLFTTKRIPAEVFKLQKNPLDIEFTMIESLTNSDELVRMKPSCCLYYLTDGAKGKCYTCPRLTKSELEEKRQEYLVSVNK